MVLAAALQARARLRPLLAVRDRPAPAVRLLPAARGRGPGSAPARRRARARARRRGQCPARRRRAARRAERAARAAARRDPRGGPAAGGRATGLRGAGRAAGLPDPRGARARVARPARAAPRPNRDPPPRRTRDMSVESDVAAVRAALLPAIARDAARRPRRRWIAPLAVLGVLLVGSTGVAAATGVIWSEPKVDHSVPAAPEWQYYSQNPYGHGGGPVLLREHADARARLNRQTERALAAEGITARCGGDPDHR